MNKLSIISSPNGVKSLDITDLHLTEEDKRTLEEWNVYKESLYERSVIEFLKSFDPKTPIEDLIPALIEKGKINE
jgi:hypothetical protein